MDIIQRNFFHLLSAGAFNEESSIEKMSDFKWNRLFQIAKVQDVVSFVTLGINRYASDKALNISTQLIEEIRSYQASYHEDDFMKMLNDQARMSTSYFNHKLKTILDKERHNIDTSLEAMTLLKIIVYNEQILLNYGASLKGIIMLGLYLRTKGDKVDFIKLDTWLKQLRLKRMAQLQGNILMTFFGFEQDEIPFVESQEPKAYSLTLKAMNRLVKDPANEWHFKQNSLGLVQNNTSILRRNLRRNMRYFSYVPIESTVNFISNFVRSMSEIEE